MSDKYLFYKTMLEKDRRQFSKSVMLETLKISDSIKSPIISHLLSEYEWYRNRNVLFIDQEFVNLISKSNFEITNESIVTVSELLKSTILAFQEDAVYLYKGRQVQLKPSLLSVRSRFDDSVTLSYNISDLAEDEIQTLQVKEIEVMFDNGDKTHRRTAHLSAIADMLPKSDLDEDDDVQLIIEAHFDFCCKMLIFNNATDGKYIQLGVPFQFKQPLSQRRDKIKRSNSTIAIRKTKTASPYICPSHFRQFWHEKYYQGDYAHMPRGSRWTIVSEYPVGDINPLTQESK